MPGDVELLLRVGVGAALGAALGMEREHRGQVAGCGRTAWWPAARRIFMLAGAYGCAAVHRGSNIDPMRVAAQAAADVGFIGGGAILKEARRPAVWSCTTNSATSRARGSGSSHRSWCAPPQASSSARAQAASRTNWAPFGSTS
jgi:uncharacterized membrane protein YhiD involved in acid resistance